MKKSLFAARFALAFFLIPSAVAAEEVNVTFDPSYVESKNSLQMSEDKEMTLNLSGNQEEGAFKFFIKQDEIENAITDITANDLNAITPAAGIQFTIDFSL